jgi:hypothetical protein
MSNSSASGLLSEDTRQILTDLNTIITTILGGAGIATLLGHVVLRTLTGKSLVKMLFGWGDENDRRRVRSRVENAGDEELRAYERAADRALQHAPQNPGALNLRSDVRRRRSISPAASQHGSQQSSSSQYAGRGGGSQSGYGRGGSQSGYGRGGSQSGYGRGSHLD